MAPTDDSKKKPSLLYLGGAGILASVVLASAYLIFTFEEADQLVLIKAPLTPVRVAPEDPGGLKINSQDSPVMSLLDEANSGNSPDQEGAEVLVPPESEPELPPITLTEDQGTSEQVKQDESVAAAVKRAGKTRLKIRLRKRLPQISRRLNQLRRLQPKRRLALSRSHLLRTAIIPKPWHRLKRNPPLLKRSQNPNRQRHHHLPFK